MSLASVVLDAASRPARLLLLLALPTMVHTFHLTPGIATAARGAGTRSLAARGVLELGTLPTSKPSVIEIMPASGRGILTLYTSNELKNRLLAADSPAVVLFGARHCRACRGVHTQLDKLAQSYPAASFFSIELNGATRHAFAEHHINAMPTVLVFSCGGGVDGGLRCEPSDADALPMLVEEALGIDPPDFSA